MEDENKPQWRAGKSRRSLDALVIRAVDLRVQLAEIELELDLLRLGHSELFHSELFGGEAL